MAKPATRIVFLQAVLAVAAAGIVVRSFIVQVVQYRVWHTKLTEHRERDVELTARRGRIYDRNGNALAVSAEEYRVQIALNEVRDTAALQALLPSALRIAKPKVDAEFRRSYPWFNGPFTAEQVESIRGIHGVHLTLQYDRVYPMQDLANPVLGSLTGNGSGLGGMERALDTLLQGRAGKAHYLRDAKGTLLPVPGPPLVAPVAGDDIYLTIDSDLQAIAEDALRRAVTANRAMGGEVVIIDVATGELLAIASVRRDSVTHLLVSSASALVAPNEPGSTSKLFTVAAVLERGGNDTLPVEGEGGTWIQRIGHTTRRIRDEDKLSGPVSLAATVKYSSNIAISKFALRLRPDEQFEMIRRFGFGTPPATGFPGEAAGVLVRPAEWVNADYSRPSLGQGYEWEATAVQLAAGYGAIANHGVLMAPSLLREVRDEHGRVVWRHRPDTVRRAVPDSVARRLMDFLAQATDSGGTGTQAHLDLDSVAGKTGTAVVRAGGYRSSFVGIFPTSRPQAVIYVMIDRATAGGYYGGVVAAPIVPAMLKQALALPKSPFDRSRLTATVTMAPMTRAQMAEPTPVHTVAFPAPPAITEVRSAEIPGLAGLPMRAAIVRLERAGFAVRLVGRSRVRATAPAAGDSMPRGSIVTVFADSTP